MSKWQAKNSVMDFAEEISNILVNSVPGLSALLMNGNFRPYPQRVREYIE